MLRQVSALLLVCLLTLNGVQRSWQISTNASTSYKAGILEYAPYETEELQNNFRLRAQAIIELIATSPLVADLDILVLPEAIFREAAAQTYIPAPEENVVPCTKPDYEYFFVEFSCAARSRRLYLVINVMEKLYCAGNESDWRCPQSGYYVYNTNVVFDREGRVISRYRKTHLYKFEWYKVNVVPEPELVTFTTDFGVTFGHFICFDMLFWDPAMQLLRDLNITDIIYPTYWFSELPFLTAVQLQEGWAYATDVNLLAADASVPSLMTTGSGIFAGRLGRLQAVIHEQATTVLLTATVPKYEHRATSNVQPQQPPTFQALAQSKRFTEMGLMRDYNVDIFTTSLLPADFTIVPQQRLCHGEFCCNFSAERVIINVAGIAQPYSAYRYRLVAYSGDNVTFQRGDSADLAICAIIACLSEELHSCGYIFPPSVNVVNTHYFNSVNVSGSFRQAERRLILPNTLDAQIMPLPLGQLQLEEIEQDNSTIVWIALNQPKLDVLTFGLWANYYSTVRDTHNLPVLENNMKNAASVRLWQQPVFVLLVAAISLTFCARFNRGML